MGKVTGTGSTLEISINSGSTYTEVENVTNMSHSLAPEVADSTDNDDAGWKSNLAGDKQGTLSFDMNYSNATGQRVVKTAALAQTLAKWRYKKEVLVGAPEIVFDGRITAFDDTSQHAEVVTISTTVTSSGVVTMSDQA